MTLVLKLLIAILVFIAATVPWFYIGEASPDDEGLPNWFIYSLIMTVFFSLFIYFAIGHFWDRLAGEDTMDSDPGREN